MRTPTEILSSFCAHFNYIAQRTPVSNQENCNIIGGGRPTIMRRWTHLPKNVKTEDAVARYDNGVLTITFQKHDSSQGIKKITLTK